MHLCAMLVVVSVFVMHYALLLKFHLICVDYVYDDVAKFKLHR